MVAFSKRCEAHPEAAASAGEVREAPERGPGRSKEPKMKDTLVKFGIAVAAVIVGLWAFNKIGSKLP